MQRANTLCRIVRVHGDDAKIQKACKQNRERCTSHHRPSGFLQTVSHRRHGVNRLALCD
jgi:hypothetical protein